MEEWDQYYYDDLLYSPLGRRAARKTGKQLKFKVGDIVRLKNGSAPAIITRHLGEGFYELKYYRSDGSNTSERHSKDLVLYDGKDGPLEDMTCRVAGYEHLNEKTEGKNKMSKETLYEVKVGEEVKFATKLAVNSAGKWVMEEKGVGTIFTVDKNTAQEVMPHTISVKFKNKGQAYSYFAEAGEFSKGEYYLTEDHDIVYVSDVDTKSKSATKDFKPVAKLETTLVTPTVVG